VVSFSGRYGELGGVKKREEEPEPSAGNPEGVKSCVTAGEAGGIIG
jgi:hypothetical protein